MVGDIQVSNFNANINSDNGSSNINSSIMNQALYDANKVEARKDLADFTAAVYAIEDQIGEEDEQA